MNSYFRAALVGAALATGIVTTLPVHSAEAKKSRAKAELEAATRLQVFLDRAEFAPGKIDGRYGEFTVKALALYRQAQGGEAPTPPAKIPKKSGAVPDVSGLDLASIEPLFLTYTVT